MTLKECYNKSASMLKGYFIYLTTLLEPHTRSAEINSLGRLHGIWELYEDWVKMSE